MANLGTLMAPPTPATVGRNSHAASINDFNLQLKQQPWYQQFIAQAGFTGRPVQLNKQQRAQLEQLIIQRGGVPPDAFNDMQIDPAGNLNTEHGFASQPTFLKALEIGGAAAAGAVALPGSVGSLIGMGGTPGVTTGAQAGWLSSTAPSLLNAAPAAATHTALASAGSIGARLAPNLVNAATSIYANRTAANASTAASQLEAQAAADALAYTKVRDAQQRQDDLDAQNKNFALYQDAQRRLDPYRQFGQRSLGQLMAPRPGAGTLAARMN